MATTQDDKRQPAEWVTFACACLVIVALVALILSQSSADDGPAAPVATLDGATEHRDGAFFVPVNVENRGGATASNVQVQAELVIEGAETTADQTIDFLPGGDDVDLVFVFMDDPADGELTVQVSGFEVP